MNIKKLKPNDATKMLHLIKAGMDLKNLNLTIYSTDKSIKYIEKLIESPIEITGYYHFGYFINNILVGFAQWQELGDVFFLKNIYVNENYRSRGVGKELLTHGIKLARNFEKKSVSLDVFSNNKSAYQWYCSLGFKENKKFTWYVSKQKLQEMKIRDLNIFPSNKYKIVNLPQAQTIFNQYGFTSLNVINYYNNHAINIGMFGNRYFKFDSNGLLENLDILQMLHLLDSNRSILLVCNNNNEISSDEVAVEKITESISMTFSL